MTRYILEYWFIKRYTKIGEWDNAERAEIMFRKPYYRHLTRRLVKIEETILMQEKGKK